MKTKIEKGNDTATVAVDEICCGEEITNPNVDSVSPLDKFQPLNQEIKITNLLKLGSDHISKSQVLHDFSNFTLRKEVIEHPQFTLAIREIARIHMRGLKAGDAQGMLLVAQTGCGKSTTLDYYERQFPRRRKNFRQLIPVLRVDTPESPSVKMLVEAILIAMGDPAAGKGNTIVQTNRIIYFFKECGVELLLIDEFQHFFDGKNTAESRRVSDWLKNLITKVKVPVVLSGLPRAISVVNSNTQLRRRFGAPHYMKPFGFTTTDEQRELRGVLKGIQTSLPCECVSLSDPEMAKCFYYASHGLFDYIVKIVDEAVSRGGTGPNGMVCKEDFARAFRRAIWMDAPDDLNPFSGMQSFRLLNKPLEPFDIWDEITQYTDYTKQKKSEISAAKKGADAK